MEPCLELCMCRRRVEAALKAHLISMPTAVTFDGLDIFNGLGTTRHTGRVLIKEACSVVLHVCIGGRDSDLRIDYDFILILTRFGRRI